MFVKPFSLVRSEIEDFINNEINPVPGYNFNQYNTIKRIHLYTLSQFEDQSLYQGREKMFFNISVPRKDMMVRFIDVDTRDIRVFEKFPKTEVAATILENELKTYLKAENFPYKLNQMADLFCTYGSVVMEHTKSGTNVVDLRNLFLDPTVDTITNSRFITTRHQFTESELRKTAKKNGWDMDAVEALIDAKAEMSDAGQSYVDDGNIQEIKSSKYIDVYKRYGMAPKHMIDDSGDMKQIRSLMIVGEPFARVKDEQGNVSEKGQVLFKSKWEKEYPYEDCHLQKIPGRWLGIGVMEGLFPMQERINEIFNQQRVSMELSSLHLFQTADPLALNNVLSQLQNGDVIKTKVQGSLQPLANEERNLQAFNSEKEHMTQLADRITFANDVLQGDIPTSMPATNAVIAHNNQASVHLYKRENFVNMIRRYIENHALPQMVNDLNSDRVLRITSMSDEINTLVNKIRDIRVQKQIIDRVVAGTPITQEDIPVLQQLEEEKLRKDGKLFIQVLKDYYKDKMEGLQIDIIIDNEQEDIATVANNTFAFLQLLSSNPGLLNSPVTQELTRVYAKKIGVDSGRLEMAMSRQQMLPTPEEGGPQAAGNPIRANAAEPIQDSQLASAA